MSNIYSYVEQNKIGTKKSRDYIMAIAIFKFEINFK